MATETTNATMEEVLAIHRLMEVGAISNRVMFSDALAYAREHHMLDGLAVTLPGGVVIGPDLSTEPITIPAGRIVPGAVKGNGDWVVEALASLLNDLLPKLHHLRVRAHNAGEEEAEELARALFYTGRVGCDNLEVIINDVRADDN